MPVFARAARLFDPPRLYPSAGNDCCGRESAATLVRKKNPGEFLPQFSRRNSVPGGGQVRPPGFSRILSPGHELGALVTNITSTPGSLLCAPLASGATYWRPTT